MHFKNAALLKQNHGVKNDKFSLLSRQNNYKEEHNTQKFFLQNKL